LRGKKRAFALRVEALELCTELGSKVAKDCLKKFFRAENYGIHILSYATKETKNGRDHSALLGLLDLLATKSRKAVGLAMITQSEKKTDLT
jgi:hypothetical protein